jgi:pyruvate dehydrogenase E1 component
MMVEQKDVFYYVTLMNENYTQPDVPAGAEADILRGCYRFGTYAPAGSAPGKAKKKVTLMGSGAILTEVVKAAQVLADEGIEAEVFSVTSWSELARDGLACEQRAIAGEEEAGEAFIAQQLGKGKGPIVAATDYVRSVPESVRAFLPEGRRYLTLGTDGFGRSDTRAALRQFFGVDAANIARAARYALG